MQSNNPTIEEKIIKPVNGWGVLVCNIVLFVASLVGICLLLLAMEETNDEKTSLLLLAAAIACGVVCLASCLLFAGYKVLAPNEAYVFTFFGKYYGTVKKDGFFWVNPFLSSYNSVKTVIPKVGANKILLKAQTLNNEKQKVNDLEGNPIEIGVMVIWRIKDAAKAVFNVENYMTYISTQCDSAIRQVARQYPYDVSENGEEKSLRGSSQEIAEVLSEELQRRVELAGIEIIDARITNLAYATEIAAAMLQRQQAAAIIAARQKIVDGAVSMVEMALKRLSDNNVVELDDERKAQMVSNLLVVLCGNKDAQPVINSGSIY